MIHQICTDTTAFLLSEPRFFPSLGRLKNFPIPPLYSLFEKQVSSLIGQQTCHISG